ncbi:sodium-translocating pyrophosphatase [Salsipaludibacter albus]|uniref:sodium-translocating pyrophosphatase n=1 Tax=Salsipaludibacter albus TaxID=2849650 RepID=UPI001EE40696|nr:sodium-translocating pyrophosphatase [Salsipaludibacter albus]MBY5161780.1 sodium-translocating pyrophosphatase [Salsipaludibacter albus]
MGVIPYLSAAAALAGLALAWYFSRIVNRADPGNEVMQELAAAIREGAQAFLRREYQWVAVFVVVMTVLIAVVLPYGAPWGAVAYLMGAIFSAIAGVVGMQIATSANVRTANAARDGAEKALPLAFKGGAVMGFTVAGMGLLGISLAYIIFIHILGVDDAFSVVATFGLGASSIALFARIGGGIYTKAADVGADLVGKVEAGIPEDDPRNPATIADNVGDNVGDVAGMGADLFESYAGSIVAPIVLAALLFGGFLTGNAGEITEITEGSLLQATFLFPLLIAAIGMIASIIGALLVRGRPGRSLSSQLHFGTNLAMVLTGVAALAAGWWLFADVDEVGNGLLLGLVIVIGLAAGYAIGFVSEYYTSDHYSPVKKLAAQSETGPATVIIAGIADGMISTVASVILIVAALAGSYGLGEVAFNIDGGGLYAAALAAIGMLATTGAVVAVDAYGPISDNAGGIAEMAHLPPEVREVTDGLDSLGNTTAAVAKGFAIGSAALTALALFRSYTAAVGLDVIDLTSVEVISGLFLGSMATFAFAAMTMKSVGRAAQAMIVEVRRQFAEIPGLREGKEGVKPDSARCVDISTAASLKEMVLPGSLAVVLPLAVGFFSPAALGGLLAGALATGFMLAIYMANAGGAWDNAKKYIEAGHHGGKGSEAHKAAVTGDTVGDPFKDTSGPAMNILIKVMTIVSLVFAPAFL